MSEEKEEGFDPFVEEPKSDGKPEETETPEPEKETGESEQETKEEQKSDKEESETGDKEEPSETPEEEQPEEAKSDKMIPEHRFKAALNAVNEQLAEAQRKLTEYESVEAPDRETDPDGYDLHIRMETSRAIMAERKDYVETIKHYNEMAKVNPALNAAVAQHPAPAKYAYDLAKKDMEIRELSQIKSSDEWKEFQKFKKSKSAKATDAKPKADDALSKVPNLNRATDVSAKKNVPIDDDELFSGAL